MALRALRAAGSCALAVAVLTPLWLPACQTRSVFLVPGGGSGGAMANVPLLDGGGGQKPAAHMDAGTHPGQHRDSGTTSVTDAAPPDDGAADAACETQQRNHQIPQPVGVYILVDQSNAMLQQWQSVSDALQMFITESSELGGVSVGIQYYEMDPQPPPADLYVDTVCKWESYQVPNVMIGALPMNRDPLLASIMDHGPLSLKTLFNNLTISLMFLSESPIDAALQGAVQGARDWATMNAAIHPAAAVLLVTNRVPTAADSMKCMPSRDKAMAAAATGLVMAPLVPTYVLGIGPKNPDLDAIAQAGGTEMSYTAPLADDVLNALLSIRQKVLPCDVTVSVSEQDLAQNKLNVELSAPGKPSERYGRVKTVADCSATSGRGEWYVEGSGADARVLLCPVTCEAARMVDNATLDVVHGCPTTLIQ